MKTVNSVMLLETLRENTREIILQAEQLKNIPVELLEKTPAKDKWSAAQVLEHLNIYCRYYLDAIEKKLHHDQTETKAFFTPGWLGNYFTKLMEPENNGLVKKKMKSPANALPATSPGAKEMLDEFIKHQHHLLNLLQIAKRHDINKNRIPISIARLITLKLGDTFRFVIAHQQRHFIQVEKTIKAVKPAILKPEPVLN
ncbi:MAG: DinB family protein [Bacteroidota bacterium]